MSEHCETGCEVGGNCRPTWSDPYGCGGCCRCLGCYAEAMDKQRAEDARAAEEPGETEWAHIDPEQPPRQPVPAEANPGDPAIEGRLMTGQEILEEAVRGLLEYYSERTQQALKSWLDGPRYRSVNYFTIIDEYHEWEKPQPGPTGALEQLVAETIERHGVTPGGSGTSPATIERVMPLNPREPAKPSGTTIQPKVTPLVVPPATTHPKPRRPRKKAT